MNYENDKKQLIKTIVVVLTVFAICKVIGVLISTNITINDDIVKKIISEVIILVGALVAAIIMKRLGTLKWTSKGFKEGLFSSGYMIVMGTYAIVMWIIKLVTHEQYISVSGGKVVLLVIAMLLAGIAEELLFRGVLLNGFLDYYGEKTVSGVRKSVIFSALIFGALHICNVFIGASLSSCILQAINAIAGGVFLGAVYYRAYKNIWPGSLVHSYFDLSFFLLSGALMGISTAESISATNITALFNTVITLFVGLFLLRKKKIEPLLLNNVEVL